MKIVFNPSEATCSDYNFNGQRVNIDGLKPREMKQYEDAVADDMLARWEFLKLVQPAQVDEVRKQAEVVSPVEPVKTPEVEEIPQINPEIVPIAQKKKVLGAQEVKEIQTKLENGEQLPNGSDKDGVTWYGEGVKEENQSLKKVRPYGKGHFKG